MSHDTIDQTYYLPTFPGLHKLYFNNIPTQCYLDCTSILHQDEGSLGNRKCHWMQEGIFFI
jgi:hypothetical protein